MTSAAAAAPVDPVAFEPEWNTADRFRKVRRDVLNLSQEEIADRLGVSRKAYASWEMGRTTPRDVVAVTRRLAMLSGVSQAWLLGIPAGSTYAQVSVSSAGTRAPAESVSTYRR